MKASFSNKLRSHTKSLVKNFINDWHFSKRLAFVRATNYVTGVTLHKSGGVLWDYQSRIILDRIKNDINPVLDQYLNATLTGECSKDAPMWVCWWDGLDQAPEVVKRCIKSVYDNAGNHPVHFIDKNNYHEFLEIPPYILRKVECGSIGLANLADYIRVVLIADFGGMWLDSTLFLSKPVPEKCFTYNFYSTKSKSASGYIADGKWATYYIGGRKDSTLFRFLKDAFECYWKKNETTIDYFLIDYLIEIAYRNLRRVKEDIDAVPVNNPHRFFLRDAMLRDEPAENFMKYIFDDTEIYKLSWKALYGKTTKSGAPSIYEYFLQM